MVETRSNKGSDIGRPSKALVSANAAAAEDEEKVEGDINDNPIDMTSTKPDLDEMSRDLRKEMSGAGSDAHADKLMISLANLTNKITSTLPKGAPTPNAASNAVYEATFKRKLALREPMSEADTTDPVRVVGWLQRGSSLVRRGEIAPDYSASCHALLNTASSLGSDSPILTILENVVNFVLYDTSVWTTTCRKIMSVSVPNAVSQAETAIFNTPAREASETIERYFARYSIPITHAQFILNVMGKDVSGDWLRPHLNKWALGLGNTALAAATGTLPDTATLRDFYDTVMKISSVVPQIVPKAVMFNVIY